MTVGLLVNDTGVAIPPGAVALVLPLLISAGIYTWEPPATEDMAMTQGNLRHRKGNAGRLSPPPS